jgi:hypothetical protein
MVNNTLQKISLIISLITEIKHISISQWDVK